jgi:hypothetical protein
MATTEHITTAAQLFEADVLDGADLLPGSSLPVADVFSI